MGTKDLDKNLTFESLLGDLSAELVNLTLDTIDAAIISSLKALVEFFDVDRCHLGELLADQDKVVVPYFYARPGIKLPQTTSVGEGYLPFVYTQIRENKLLVFSKTSELPKEANQDRTVIDNMGIKSSLIIPLKIDDEVRFALSLGTIVKQRLWSDETIRQTKIIANILAHVLQRKSMLLQINTEKEWSEAIMEGMPQLTYVMNSEGKLVRWNKNFQNLTGYSAEELPNKTSLDFMSDEHYKEVSEELQKIMEDG